MLARQFPPIGGAGVHRTIGSVRYLPELGYEPVIVTGSGASRDRWEPLDQDLLERIPAGVPVHRVDGVEPDAASGLARLRGTPPWVRWWVDRCAQLGREVGRGADVVYASCLPYETAFAGAALARTLGVPWVADLEDLWALDEMRVVPSGLHRALDRRRMRRALATAAGVVLASPTAAERVCEQLPGVASHAAIRGIPIGFDLSDFPAVAPPRTDGVFRIVHTGSLHTDLGEHLRDTAGRRRVLGGMTPGVDVITRSAVYLVEAVAGLIAESRDLAARIEVHLAGELTERDRAALAGHPFVRTPGALGHREALALMRTADLLFLPMHDLPPGRRAGLIPYKTYEYLASGRPILAAVPDGDARSLLAPMAHVSLVRPADVAGMAQAIRERLAAAATAGGHEPAAEPPPELARRQSVARIAELLDAVC
jgi:glycosyltransferase involved in cell wall biosynthesis